MKKLGDVVKKMQAEGKESVKILPPDNPAVPKKDTIQHKPVREFGLSPTGRGRPLAKGKNPQSQILTKEKLAEHAAMEVEEDPEQNQVHSAL